MKTNNPFTTRSRKSNSLLGLASASVLLTVAACGDQGAISLDSIQATLDQGEDIDVVLSTNEDGSLVVNLDDGGTGGLITSDAAGAMYALTNQHDLSQQISAAEDAASEPERINQVVAYSRDENGVLTQIGVYDTGGVGENIRNSGANPLASQDPLIVSKDQRFVFAVNAGSESISSFTIDDDFGLTPASLNVSSSGQSGAQNPVSLTMFEDIQRRSGAGHTSG